MLYIKEKKNFLPSQSLAQSLSHESDGTCCSVAGPGRPPRCDGGAHSFSGAGVTANMCCATMVLPVEYQEI